MRLSICERNYASPDSGPPTKKGNAAIKISFTFTNASRIHTGLFAHGYGCEMFDACVANASAL